MNSIHKNQKLLPYQLREVYRRWRNGEKATDLAKHYEVSRKTLYEIFKKARLGIFGNYSSKNMRYRTLEYGLKKPEKIEKKGKKKLKKKRKKVKQIPKRTSGRNGAHRQFNVYHYYVEKLLQRQENTCMCSLMITRDGCLQTYCLIRQAGLLQFVWMKLL